MRASAWAVTISTVGILHPGEMGSSLAGALTGRGYTVLWLSQGRSDASRRRAADLDLVHAGTIGDLTRSCDLIMSVCPPDAALDVARQVGELRPGFPGLYLDANAIAPATARRIARVIEEGGGDYIDGGITATPPTAGRSTHLYLSGARADEVAALFAHTGFEARVLSDDPTAASAMKVCYAAWSKGTAALLLDVLALATSVGIVDQLVTDWAETRPDVPAQRLPAGYAAARKGWRWTGEMLEIAATFREAGLPDGFHLAAAEVFGRPARNETAPADEATLSAILAALADPETARP